MNKNTEHQIRCEVCKKRISKKQYEQQSHRKLCCKHYRELLVEFGIGG